MDVLRQLITTKLRMKIIVKEGKRRCNWLKWNPWDGFMALAHTVTQNYTYQKSEIAHWCKWLKWNLWDGCMVLAHTVTQNYTYQKSEIAHWCTVTD